jgi:hypothetical protein
MNRRPRAWKLVLVAFLAGTGNACSSVTTPLPSPIASLPTPCPSAALGASQSPADADDEVSDCVDSSATGIPVPTASAAAVPVRLPGEPDPALTPGALNPDVTQLTINSTICVANWTATIRPPSSFTTSLKIVQIVQYGYSDTAPASYEEDHLISLQLGGAPADQPNLWPEPYTIGLTDGRSTGARIKDGFETKLKKQVCAGSLSLAAAQAEIGPRWVHAFYGIP